MFNIMSFDVVSLFTKVPTGDTLRVLEDLLAEDDTLRDRTTLPDFVSTPFTFTLEVTCMGSPLSPVITNIYMQDFESKVLVKASLKPSLWLHYVDDTLRVQCKKLLTPVIE